jgi:hypothetical protein
VSTDRLDLAEPHDPALDRLFQALTAGGTADEMAGRAAALETFRASRQTRRVRTSRLRQRRLRVPRLRPYRLRLAFSVSTAAAALVLSGGIAAAYTAALPAPVQHIAYRVLGRIGVPDTHRPAPPASAPGPAASVSAGAAPMRSAAASPAPASSGTASSGTASPGTASPGASTGGCPCPAASRTAAGAVPGLTLVAARTQIPAGGTDVLTGRVTSRGRPEAGAQVRLFERIAGRPGWRAAGRAVTDASGTVTLTVAHLAGNAWFRLTARGGAQSPQVLSPPVLITVIPPVSLDVAAGPRAGLDVLTARAPSAAAGGVIVLQKRVGGVWYRVGQRVLGQDHQASFSVLVPASGRVAYRAVLPRTVTHGRSVSPPVRIAARPEPKP